MSLSARERALGLTLALALVGNCSSHDVSLGEDLPTPEPTPEPPAPVPSGPQPCEINEPEAACVSQHCSGRILTRPGFECQSGQICCVQLITVPPPGGASGLEPPGAGAGGQ